MITPAVYRYPAYDLRTLTFLGHLPLSDVSYSQMLNGAGEFSASMSLNVQRQTAPGVYSNKAAELIANTITARTLVCVERNNQLIDGYILWTRNYSSDKPALELGGKSIWSYFEHRMVRSSVNPGTFFTSTDQMLIARTLVNNAQAVTGGNVNITVGTETCGVNIDRTYWNYEFKPVAEAVQEIANSTNGFDFFVQAAYVSGVPTFTLQLSYPKRGREATTNGIIFEAGKNLIAYGYPEDSATQANLIYVIGAGDGFDQLSATGRDTSVIDAGWPLLESQRSYKDEKVIVNLNNLATKAVADKAQPVTIPTFTVLGNTEPVFGSWLLGDSATFRLNTNADKPDFRWAGLGKQELIRRIVGQRVSVGNQGQEVVEVVTN
jgi:hypothetical protein